MLKNKRLLSVIAAVIIMITCNAPITALAVSESEIRNKIVSVASNEVGYTGTSSYSKYGDWYGYQGGWCTTFVLWCYNQAGSSLNVSLYSNITPSGGNCNSMISWYKNKGLYHEKGDGYTPKAGDLVFFDWSGNGSSQHVGIVKSVSGSTVYTIEGNCSGSVKSREYTTSGSKPYNNVSAIMGYASPNFSSVSSSSGTATTKKNTTTTKKQTTSKSTTKKSTTTTTKKAETTTSATTETTTVTTTEAKQVTSLELSAETQELSIGDTVKLNYSIEPEDTKAVVGYFCDEEGIIQIDNAGDITAIGEGTATVVVCVNDELYSQCDFTVTDSVGEVTTLSSERTVVGSVESEETTQQDIKSVLTNIGINVNALTQNERLYIIPASIICATALVSVIISASKKKNKDKE